MLRYKTKTRPGLVALYDIRPGNGAGQFLQPQSPHGAISVCVCVCVCVQHREKEKETDREKTNGAKYNEDVRDGGIMSMASDIHR